MATKERIEWGADEEEEYSTEPGSIYTKIEDDGTKIVTEYKLNDDGKKVKVTRKIRMVLVKTQANHAVAERKKLPKFGQVRGFPAGPDSNSTSVGEPVTLKLTTTGKLDDKKEEVSLKAGLAAAKIMCRICKGDHWTTKCPFKDSIGDLSQLGTGGTQAPAADTGAEESKGASSSGKYVPPSKRLGSTAVADLPAGTRASRGMDDGTFTIRITNLSEDVTEQDVRDLVSRFGPTHRIFVARDKETNICKGFAFISYYDKDKAQKAMDQLNGYGYDNLILRVEWAK
ncbi:eukaryotic translation initiation factor 3 subunit G-domain-containing protein [Polychytrium aggregatum]|uniref:eukaryotic translation initiation factor 3 subunit G-domain-containing protein n=1 Tax=Polychytrium aggregatum TaxID=110093 RepID=UPI0022FE2E30|nr:eukaryotic translation initiation factor 3 subunit G-domain-containing protein [Polychytrium aggregatum]KAI9208100.1 eukaryotic translation initiation factor 3 subunit G-domain-containing protein [Polychytrium aggregatum]